ncbi:aspartic peptidase domain-containing protein [Pilaira anomala]|nr:aspartic peptidase domain-containing protein [Pilaira anomala]
MHITTVLLILSASSILAAPTANKPQPIQLPLQMIQTTKNHQLSKRSESLSLQLLEEIDLIQFFVKIQVGTPAQEFNMLFDTGSADTWVPSTECSAALGCPQPLKRFNSSASSTYKALKDPFVIQYAIGTASGTYFKEKVSFVNGNDEQLITIKDQTMAKVLNSAGPISDQKKDKDNDGIFIDGILGAGLPSGTVRHLNGVGEKYDTFPVSLYKANLIPDPVFSVSMNGMHGKLTLGAIDTEYVTDDFVYTSIANSSTSPSRWSIMVEGLQFSNKEVGTPKPFKFNTPTPCGVDTGSNFMYLPTQMANELAMDITNSTHLKKNDVGVYLVDCGLQKSQESVSIFFRAAAGNALQNITMPVSDLVTSKKEDGQCLLKFYPSDSSLTLGNMVLRKYVTVFDFGPYPHIGFAPVKY